MSIPEFKIEFNDSVEGLDKLSIDQLGVYINQVDQARQKVRAHGSKVQEIRADKINLKQALQRVGVKSLLAMEAQRIVAKGATALAITLLPDVQRDKAAREYQKLTTRG